MRKFKVGDRVRIVHRKPDNDTGGQDWNQPNGDVGKVGTITADGDSSRNNHQVIQSIEDAADRNPYLGWFDEELELVGANTTKTTNTIMQKLGTMMKKLLDADTQTLVRAGYVNGDLGLTFEGKDSLLNIIFDAHKADLVALAQEKLDEEKASK